jgi:hypothetical protein
VTANGSDKDDRDILNAMLDGANVLCRTDDALLRGQYEYLRARIQAVIELRLAADGTERVS